MKVEEGSENSPHREELLDPVVSVIKAASSDEQAVQLGVDSSSRNQSLSQGLHPPDPLDSYPRMHTTKIKYLICTPRLLRIVQGTH